MAVAGGKRLHRFPLLFAVFPGIPAMQHVFFSPFRRLLVALVMVVAALGASSAALAMRVSPIEYRNDGTITETPADDDFLIFPPQGVLLANARQVIRVQWVGPPLDSSRAYYVSINQLPVPLDAPRPPGEAPGTHLLAADADAVRAWTTEGPLPPVKRKLFLAVAEVVLISAASALAPAFAGVAAYAPADAEAPATTQPPQSAWDNPDLPVATAPWERAAQEAMALPAAAALTAVPAAPTVEQALDGSPAELVLPAAAPAAQMALAASDTADPPAVARAATTFSRPAAFPPDAAPSPLAAAPATPQAANAPAATAPPEASPQTLAQVTVVLPVARPAPVPASPPASGAPSSPPATDAGNPPAVSVPLGPYGRPHINPYQRDIDMTVPLMYRDQP